MSYESVVRGLSEGTVKIILQLWAAVEAGRLTRDDFKVIAVDVIAVARAQGAAAALAVFRAYLETATRVPAAVVVPPLPDPRERLSVALTTVLASELDTVMQLTRIATNEPLEAAHTVYGDAVEQTETVTGWTRGLDSDPCQLCQWWAREGRVWRPDHRMPRHKGCACHQVPVINVGTSNYQTTQQARWAEQTRITRERKRA